MKHLIFSLFLLISLASQAQIINHKATHQAFRTADEYSEKFGPWSEWEKINKIIYIDLNTEILVVKDYPKIIYTFESQLESVYTEDRDIVNLQAIDENNSYCIIELVHYTKTGKNQIYIRWKNFQLVYEITKIESNEP